jgi:CMP-N-acetylneuraminic acid synthetase
MSHIAIIPARGGSQRLPKKNIIDFLGKPLLAWTIEAALATGLFSRVLVSTDAPEIAQIAEQYGASVPFLRRSAHDHHSPIAEATCVALEQCAEELGERYDLVTQLMANTPLRNATDIRSAVQHFHEHDAPAQISCFAFGWMNPWWAVTLADDGTPSPLFPEALKTRSQDLPTLYCPTGAIWIARTDVLLNARTFYCPGHRFFPLTWQSALDIDDAEDLAMARAVFEARRSATESQESPAP